MDNNINKFKNYEILRASLENERSSFISHWRDLGDYILPTKPRFTVSNTNKGDRRNTKIIDSTATLAARTLRSGMMSGVTSPARPWFKLEASDPTLHEMPGVKEWLDKVTRDMINIFLRSNLYNVLPNVYGSIGVFATAAMYVEEDFDTVVRFAEFPIGSYCVSNDSKGKVNCFIREMQMTVRQLIEKFAVKDQSGKVIKWDNFSSSVRNLYESGNLESSIDIYHTVKKNEYYDENKLESKYKAYSSCYYEKGMSEGVFLHESGFDSFRVLCPRWERSAEDSYGTDCPGMTCLGDVKALQLMHKRKAQAIEKMINPPLLAPTSLKSVATSMLPGDVTYVDENESQKGMRPLHEVNLQIQPLLLDIQDHQQRINKAFFVDLFLMLSQTDRRQITAREIEERHEEKLLALGPVLEQINQDLLDPLIDITFEIMLKQGRIPEPPDELKGTDIKVEYVSIMSQAQKLVGLAGVDRFSDRVGQVAQYNPSVLDKINTDQLIDVYGDMTSVPAGIIRSDEEVSQIRNQREQAQKAQEQAMLIQQGANAASSLSSIKMDEDTALNRIMQQATAGQLAEI